MASRKGNLKRKGINCLVIGESKTFDFSDCSMDTLTSYKINKHLECFSNDKYLEIIGLDYENDDNDKCIGTNRRYWKFN